MNTALAFLRSREADALVARASRAAGMPVAIHHMTEESEGPRIAGAGACAACRFVADVPGGAQACRASRTDAALTALRRNRTVPFVCHGGFGCVCGGVFRTADERFVLTVGPFCPPEAPHTLEDDFAKALSALDGDRSGEPLPDLADIRIAPADVAAAIVEWTAEALTQTYESHPTDDEEDAPVIERARRRGRAAQPDEDPFRARAIAAALAAGESAELRGLVQSALEEAPGNARTRRNTLRARAVAVAAAALEAAAAAGLPTSTGWQRFSTLVEDVAAMVDQKGDSESALATAVMRVLSAVRRTTRRAKPADAGIRAVERLVKERIADQVTLGDLAAELGKHPTAITHQLQRKFGMSFTQYVGRLRVDKAKELLRRTKLGVSEVGKRVGIGDQSNFSKLFKKFEGLSPVEYRARFGRTRS